MACHDGSPECPTQEVYRRRRSIRFPSSADHGATLLQSRSNIIAIGGCARNHSRNRSSPGPMALFFLSTILYFMFLFSQLSFLSDGDATATLLVLHDCFVGDEILSRNLQSPNVHSQAKELLPRLPSVNFRPNYGQLKLKMLDPISFTRLIQDDDDEHWHIERRDALVDMDEKADPRDFSKSDPGKYDHYDEHDYPKASGCYRPTWSYEVHPTCISFHELTLERPVESTGFDLKYLGRGYFRTTWLFESDHDEFVLKLLKLNERRDFNQYTYSSINAEALSMERTTASTKTSNIYGHCGSSILVERGLPISNSILPSYKFFARDEVQQPSNRIALEQKLSIALQMTEGLAVLHGDPKGVIVHDDIQLEQWLLGLDGNIKLNDFNNARVLQWNFNQSQYCTFRAGYEYLYRAPEENTRHPTDESADVYGLGQVFYSILTGLLPFYDRSEWDAALEANGRGDLPYIDPHYRSGSFIERRLVELMEIIWQFQPRDRPSIFAVISHLRETIRIHEQLHPDEVPITNISHFNLVQ